MTEQPWKVALGPNSKYSVQVVSAVDAVTLGQFIAGINQEIYDLKKEIASRPSPEHYREYIQTLSWRIEDLEKTLWTKDAQLDYAVREIERLKTGRPVTRDITGQDDQSPSNVAPPI